MKLHEIVRAAPKIGVFGSDGEHCTERAEELAYETGQLLAERGAILFTGGGQGVMEYASKGAVERGGLVINIWPDSEIENANTHYSLIIPTGIGLIARGQILTNSIYGAILIEGGSGTHQEASSMYLLKKPTVAIKTSGGVAAEVAGRSLDKRNLPPILSADYPRDAVDLLLSKLTR